MAIISQCQTVQAVVESEGKEEDEDEDGDRWTGLLAIASRLKLPSAGQEGGDGLETSMQLQVGSGVRAVQRSREYTMSHVYAASSSGSRQAPRPAPPPG